MTCIISPCDVKRTGKNCLEICGISFGCAFRMDGCKATYELRHCMFSDIGSPGVYEGIVSLRFHEDGNCASCRIDFDSLREIVTGMPCMEPDGLIWVGFLQPAPVAVA